MNEKMKIRTILQKLKYKKKLKTSKMIIALNDKISNNQQQLATYINKFLQNEEKWKLINYLIKNINSTLEIDDLLKLICSQITKLIGSNICCIYLFNIEKQQLVFKYANTKGPDKNLDYMENFINDKNINILKFMNTDMKNGASYIKNYLNESLNKKYHITPIINNSNFFGIIFLYKDAEGLNNEEINILQIIAENISMALNNADLYDKLKLSNKNKNEFIASLTHEFKTPLNTIMGFAEILKNDSNLSQNQVDKYSRNILNCSKHLLKLIEDIQDTSIAESGNIPLYYEKFNAKSLIVESISNLEGIINKKNLTVNSHLIDTMINADVKRLRQVIFNLFSNAIKFSNEKGQINVITYLQEDTFYFEITNFGKPIENSEKHKLFRLFYHINPTPGESYEGAGIGLALCKKIITFHKGKIDFISDEKNGTTFFFAIPIDQPSILVEDKKNLACKNN